jgi:AcrR family transcriptional regulator
VDRAVDLGNLHRDKQQWAPNTDAQSGRTVQIPPKTGVECGREVRQRLLSTAVELIPELGWNAVSTRILAQRARVGPGLVHYHFESLQALLREASLDSMSEALQGVAMIFAQAETLQAGFDMLVGALDAYTGTDRASLLFVEVYLASRRDLRLAQEVATVVVDFRRRFAAWVAARGQPDPAPTAAVLAAALDGVLLHRAIGPDLTSSAVRHVLSRVLVRTQSRRRRVDLASYGKELTPSESTHLWRRHRRTGAGSAITEPWLGGTDCRARAWSTQPGLYARLSWPAYDAAKAMNVLPRLEPVAYPIDEVAYVDRNVDPLVLLHGDLMGRDVGANLDTLASQFRAYCPNVEAMANWPTSRGR